MAEVHTLALQLRSEQMERALARVDKGLAGVAAQSIGAEARIKTLGGTAGVTARALRNLATNATARNVQNLAKAAATAQRSVAGVASAATTAATSVRNLNNAASTSARGLGLTAEQLNNLVSRMMQLTQASTSAGAALQRIGQGGGRSLVPIANSMNALTVASDRTAIGLRRLNTISLDEFLRLRSVFSGTAVSATRAGTAFTGFASAATRASAAATGFAGGAQRASTAMTVVAGQAARMSGEVTRVASRMREAQTAAGGFAESIQRAARGMSIFNTAIAGISIFSIARGFIELQNAFIQTDNAIRFLVKDTEQADRVYAKLQESAIRTGTAMELNGQVFRRLAIGTNELGLDSNRLADIVGILNDAMFASGTTAQEARAALIQLGQGLASGTLRGDEFRSVAEQLPAVALAIADSLGVTIGQLRAFAHQGQLTPDIVIAALERAAPQFRAQAEDMERSFSHSANVMVTSAQGLAREIERVIPIGDTLRFLMERVGEGMVVAARLIAEPRERYAELSTATGAVSQATAEFTNALEESGIQLTDQQQRVLDSITATDASTEALRRAQAVIRQIATPQEEYNRKIQEYTELAEQGLLTDDQRTRAIKLAGEALSRASGSTERFNEFTRRTSENLRTTSTRFTDVGRNAKNLSSTYRAHVTASDSLAAGYGRIVASINDVIRAQRSLQREIQRTNQLLSQQSRGFGGGRVRSNTGTNFVTPGQALPVPPQRVPRFQRGSSFVEGPSGTDRIPAFLTRGEGVVNAGANRRNPGIVEALNNGERVGGGTVLNFNISTPDADSFLRSREQIRRSELAAAQRTQLRSR